MQQPYRMPGILPSLLTAALITGCDKEPSSRPVENASSIGYLEAVQEAEAARYGVEQRNLEQARLDQLLGRGQTLAR